MIQIRIPEFYLQVLGIPARGDLQIDMDGPVAFKCICKEISDKTGLAASCESRTKLSLAVVILSNDLTGEGREFGPEVINIFQDDGEPIEIEFADQIIPDGAVVYLHVLHR